MFSFCFPDQQLLHFLPEKNAKEFVPPTCSCFNEPSTAIATAVGKGLIKYDVCTGSFLKIFPDIHTAELTAMCLDGDRGRRLFVGCGDGKVLIVNFMTGAVIDRAEVHTKEITSIICVRGAHNKIYTGSLDGRIKVLEESGGVLRIHNSTSDCIFGEGVGVTGVSHVKRLRAIVVSSSTVQWGVWNSGTFKKLLVVKEDHVVHCVRVIPSPEDDEYANQNSAPPQGHGQGQGGAPGGATKAGQQFFQHLFLTVAVALNDCIRVYTIDLQDLRGVMSYELTHHSPIYISHMNLLNSPEAECVNYSNTRRVTHHY